MRMCLVLGGGVDNRAEADASEAAVAEPTKRMAAMREEPVENNLWDHANLDGVVVGSSRREAWKCKLPDLNADGPIDLDIPIKPSEPHTVTDDALTSQYAIPDGLENDAWTSIVSTTSLNSPVRTE